MCYIISGVTTAPVDPATQGGRGSGALVPTPTNNLVWYMVNWLLVVNFMSLKLINFCDRQTKLVMYYDH